MTVSRILFALILGTSLSGCFQTSLGGPTGASVLSVAPLRDSGNTLFSTETRDQQDWIDLLGQDKWTETNPLFQLLLLGTIGFSNADLNSLDPAALYLVTANSGTDYAPDGGTSISDSPQVVQGQWHAIATGQRIIDGNLQVSALSEASYQQVLARLPQLTDAQVLEQLDAAARLLVKDMDDSGSVDYNDVLRWARTTHANKYLGNISDIDAMALAIRSSQPADMLQAAARDVLGSRRVELQTNFGTITLDTLNWEAPITADNFVRYVEDKFYEGIVFHRVRSNFMIQTGIWELVPGTNTVLPKDPRGTIRNESRYSVSNLRGTLSMARTSDPDSASAQFFINQVDNSFLDFGSANNPDGYTVFADVVTGIEVVDEIASLPAAPVNGISEAVPFEIVLIEAVTIVN